MAQVIRHFRDRRKRPWRPKMKIRPPLTTKCCRKRPETVAAPQKLNRISISYLNSHLARTKRSQTFELTFTRLIFHATTATCSTKGGHMDDEEPLTGEFLRSICAALSRNAIKSLKGAAIVLGPDDEPALKKLPKSERQPQLLNDRERRQEDALTSRR